MINVAKKISMSKKHIGEIDSFMKNKSEKGISLGEDSLLLTNGYVIAKIPSSRIKNLGDLKFYKGQEIGYAPESFFNRFEENEELGKFTLESLGNLVVEQKLKSGINQRRKKLTRYTGCNQGVQSCSIAQGLQLGYNYDHCGNCHSAPEKLFLNYFITLKNNLKDKEVFEAEKASSESKEGTKYYSFMNLQTSGLMREIFRDISFDLQISPTSIDKFGREKMVYGNTYEKIRSEAEKSLEDNLRLTSNFIWFELSESLDLKEEKIKIVGVCQGIDS